MYMDINHLKRLSKLNSSKSVRFLTPIAHPGSHCPMHSAVGIAASIKGLSSLVIGARECGYYSKGIPNVADTKNGHHWAYAMDSTEVVFGCKAGVIDALKQLDATGTEAIALISTCVPEIIGEDLDAIINEAQPEIKAKLIGVKAPQFNANGSASGGLNFYEAVIGLMEKRTRLECTVNLLGYDPAIFRRKYPPKLLPILEAEGLNVRYYFASHATVADYSKAPEAALNIVFSIHNIKLAERMKERFGVPYVVFQDLYSVADLDNALTKISHELNVELMSHFAEEREKALASESAATKTLRGKKFIITHPFRDTIPLAAYLCTLGMEPLLINVDEYLPHNVLWSESILSYGHDPYICHMVNEKADAALLNSLPFDICIGRFKHISAGRACFQDMSNLALTYDYKRTAGLLTALNREMDKTYGLI